MLNLAGHKNPDPIVEEELFVAGVKIVRSDEPQQGEVATRISGRLGDFTFTRSWCYWIVKGDVPLHVAQTMYDHSYGGHVRVAGHCSSPRPEDFAEHRDARGKEVVIFSDRDRELFREYDAGKLDGTMRGVLHKLREELVWVDTVEEQKSLTVASFITLYHIDSQAGLKVFTDAVVHEDVIVHEGALREAERLGLRKGVAAAAKIVSDQHDLLLKTNSRKAASEMGLTLMRLNTLDLESSSGM